MDPIWILFAFVFGYLVKQIGLPPLVGFLAAGFALHLFGVENSSLLQHIADFGVLLLLFTIGLKLQVKNLLRSFIWGTSSLHMLVTVILMSGILFLCSLTGFFYFSQLQLDTILLISFALSFSSTIFAVKILEETGTMKSMHGKIAIGILVMQDIFAVLFLTLASDKTPSPWAFALLLLLFIPKLLQHHRLSRILDGTGHGELLVLLGVLIPMVGASLFDTLGLKPDLGALISGVLFARHKRANELAQTMMHFKDLFLVGFFLTIGLSGFPTWAEVGIALLFTLLIPLKMILFFFILTRFRLRARTSFLTSLSLANYSEFGLIVGAAAVAAGWLPQGWLIIFALSLSFTFVLSAQMNMASQRIFARWQKRLLRFETSTRLPEDRPIAFSAEEVIIFGMGRAGTQAYKVMANRYGKKVLGIDIDPAKIKQHKQQGRRVIRGDAMDLNFWQRINLKKELPVILLATSSHVTHMKVIEQLKELHCDIQVAAISRFDDEMRELRQAGVQVVFNLYVEAGAGFANHAYQSLFGSQEAESALT